jgi:acetyltransferase-like isoleucine patch superfamily enzyme
LTLGTLPYGFATGRDDGILRVHGRLRVRGRVAIGVGSRIEVGPDACMDVGEGTYFSPNVRIIVSSGLTIGRGCAVGWDVQILDDDQHAFRSGNRQRPRTAPVILGDRVWVGSKAMIFKGVEIADGCVVASGAVVTRSVDEPNSLVAGNPASVVRRGIVWE